MTKLQALAFVLVFVLAACTGPTDPYEQIAAGQAKIESTKRAGIAERKATAEAEQVSEQATLAARGAAQAEIDLANQRAKATADALDLEVRSLEATALAAQATQGAEQFGVAVQATRQAVDATATAMAIEMETERRRTERELAMGLVFDVGKMVGLGLLLLALGAGVVIGVIYLWKLQDWAIVWRDRKKHIFHSPDGTIWVQYDENGNAAAVLVREMDYFRRRPQLAGGSLGDAQAVDGVEWISPSVTASPMGARKPAESQAAEQIEAALQVVEGAIEYYETGEAMSIPRWHRIKGMSSDAWMMGVNYLKGLGLAENAPGKKTVTFASLKEILFRLQRDASPTP